MQLRVLSGDQVRAVLPMSEAIAAMRDAFGQLARGQTEVPLRSAVRTPTGVSLFMPGYLAGTRGLAQKIISVFPGNSAKGLPVVSGMAIVLDPATGLPLALLEGSTLTSIRTGAASGLATELLARPESCALALFGAGGQAYDQVLAIRAVRKLAEVRIVSRTSARSQALVDRLRGEGMSARAVADPADAVRGADILACATDSRAPLFRDVDVSAGTHINAIGAYSADMCEVPAETVARARVVVDQVEAALAEAGDLIQPLRSGLIAQQHIETTLGQVVSGQAVGRRSADEITLFKSVGLAVQDVAAACRALARAEADNVGTIIEL